MFEFQTAPHEALKKRVTYLKATYLIALGLSLIYLWKFNFEYHVGDYNLALVSNWLLLALIPPALLYGAKSYRYAALATLILTTLIAISLLYVAGGVDAPGIFWLTAIPLMTAIHFKERGAAIGTLTAIAILSVFWYLKKYGIGPNLVAQYGNYGFEKIFNVVIFIIFSSVTTHYYIRSEQKFARKIAKQNVDVENLLQVLLHDIANTLSSMTYNLVKARDQQQLPATSELDKIEKAVEDINNLLAQVRHLKSVKDGKARMPLKPIALAMILNEVYEKTETLAAPKGIKIALDLSRERLMINSERTILGNVVLLNLLSNAVKFSQPGDRIDLRAYGEDGSAVIEIQDYGIGMPKELLQQIFCLNSYTTREGTQGEKGTGYGLPLVKEYLQMMGGSIHIVSQENSHPEQPQGTKVTLRIPLVP